MKQEEGPGFQNSLRPMRVFQFLIQSLAQTGVFKKTFKWDMNVQMCQVRETSGRMELHGAKASFCVYSVAANPAGKGADFR